MKKFMGNVFTGLVVVGFTVFAVSLISENNYMNKSDDEKQVCSKMMFDEIYHKEVSAIDLIKECTINEYVQFHSTWYMIHGGRI